MNAQRLGSKPKIRAPQREVSQLSELEKGKTTKVLRKYSQLSVTEALETAKQWLTVLAGEGVQSINRMSTTEPSKAYCQWEGNKIMTEHSRCKSELWRPGESTCHSKCTLCGRVIRQGQSCPGVRLNCTGRDIWEKEASHNTHAQWLVDLREDASHLPEQDLVNITMTTGYRS